jgi:CelD/BcsL family acetyltransferase involved in cellulose biosynthesis
MNFPEIFYTYQWAWAVQRAYTSSLIPFLVLAYQGDDLAGVASLATNPEQGSASFLAGTTADYCEFLSHPSKRGMLVDATFSELNKNGITRIEMANLPADSSSLDAIHAAAQNYGYQPFFRPAYLCARVELGTGDNRKNLKTNVLGKEMFRRKMNRMLKQGPVALIHSRAWDEVEPILDKFFVAHVARFLSMGRISNLSDSKRRVFLAELANALSLSGYMTLSRLEVAGRSVAWNFGFQFCGSWFWYQPTFAVQEEFLSPGFCLLTRIIAEACDTAEIQVVDLGLGAEGYKDRLANSTRATLYGIIDRSYRRHFASIARYRLAQTMKSSRLEAFIRRVRHRLKSVGERLRSSGLGKFAAWGLWRLARYLFARDEVIFYRWDGNSERSMNQEDFLKLAISPIDTEILAAGAMKFESDAETHEYLVRSAQRLHKGNDRGFALLDPNGIPVHLCWMSTFKNFYVHELDIHLEEGDTPDAVVIYDCWTPNSVRGHGYYAAAVSRMADKLSAEGADPWIFSAATNRASIRGLERTGFRCEYSVVSSRIVGFQWVKKSGLTASQTVAPANTRPTPL